MGTIIWKKIPGTEKDWGIYGPALDLVEGATVLVTRKDGSSSEETVAEVTEIYGKTLPPESQMAMAKVIPRPRGQRVAGPAGQANANGSAAYSATKAVTTGMPSRRQGMAAGMQAAASAAQAAHHRIPPMAAILAAAGHGGAPEPKGYHASTLIVDDPMVDAGHHDRIVNYVRELFGAWEVAL